MLLSIYAFVLRLSQAHAAFEVGEQTRLAGGECRLFFRATPSHNGRRPGVCRRGHPLPAPREPHNKRAHLPDADLAQKRVEMSASYTEGEKILSYHGNLIYEAKVSSYTTRARFPVLLCTLDLWLRVAESR